MKQSEFQEEGVTLIRSLLGAVLFYTCIPLPRTWQLEFQRIARWAACLGLLIGGILGLADFGLQELGIPSLTRSVLVVGLGVAMTGGLHLDGVSDTADGLAVQDPQQRLQVMKDSLTGAFGVMAVLIVLLLKVAALSELSDQAWLGLMVAGGWGRWGQVIAIALYPYLKPTGKGAFHREAIQLPQDILLGLFFLLGLSTYQAISGDWQIALVTVGISSAIAFITGYWFHRQLGGHTGDTYGAVVEWTEAFILCALTILL